MAKIDDFRNAWERLEKMSHIVKTMDDNKDFNESFQGYFRDFSEFLQTEYKYDGETVNALPVGNIRNQLNYAQSEFDRRRYHVLDDSLGDLEDIVDDLGDKKVQLAVRILPIKDEDMDKSHDLNKLIDSYKDSVKKLKENIKVMDPETETYKTQETTIKEYQEFASLLEDNKELIKNILGFREHQSYAIGEKGRPNTPKMREIYFSYLDSILEKFKDNKDKYNDNLPTIEALKMSSGDDHFLMGEYARTVLRPAEKKFESVADKSDLKKYITRTVRASNPNKQVGFFEKAYELASEKEAEKIEENLAARRHELYGFALKKAA